MAFFHASEGEGTILPLYIIDEQYEQRTTSRKLYMATLAAVYSLAEELEKIGARLIVRKGNPIEVLRKLTQEIKVDKLFFNRSYTPQGRDRDEAVTEALLETGVWVKSFKDAVLHETTEILNKQGKPYVVFTPYKRVWLQLPKEKPVPKPEWVLVPSFIHSLHSESIPLIDTSEYELLWEEYSESHARERLRTFMETSILQYKQAKEYPATDGTSKVSIPLKLGTLSIRTVYQCLMDELNMAKGEQVTSVEAFLTQLIWRDFYQQILFHFPHTGVNSFLPEYQEIAWQNDHFLFQRWCDGETGFPIVDAAMKQLNQTGWMHNRLRMITASFLTKDLLVDWRWGADYFKQKLLDHEEALNIGGWQWSASTGTDPQPYFRIFNPVTQGEKFDPEGEFVRNYIPSLQKVPRKYVHQPWEMPEDIQKNAGCIVGVDYPAPCVNHAFQRQIAISLFQEAKATWNRQKQ